MDKWRQRADTADAPMGPRSRRMAALTAAEEAMVVEFRRRTLLPLDDVFGSLRDNLPKLSRSALHRCLVRHGISRLPAGDPAAKHKRFAAITIGSVPVDACDLEALDSKLAEYCGQLSAQPEYIAACHRYHWWPQTRCRAFMPELVC